MVIDGTKKIVRGWSARGHLLLGQGNKVIEINAFQAEQLMDFIAEKKRTETPNDGSLAFVPGDDQSKRGG